jgi:hypothetical protein
VIKLSSGLGALRRVMFLSRRALSENTRYPGGAFRPGAMREFVNTHLRGDISFSCAGTPAGGADRSNFRYRLLNPRWLP